MTPTTCQVWILMPNDAAGSQVLWKGKCALLSAQPDAGAPLIPEAGRNGGGT